jgi:hypothetical protein
MNGVAYAIEIKGYQVVSGNQETKTNAVGFEDFCRQRCQQDQQIIVEDACGRSDVQPVLEEDVGYKWGCMNFHIKISVQFPEATSKQM